MRRPLLLLVLLALSGCQQDFDEQYAATEKQLQMDAKRIDSEMAKEAAREVEAPDPSIGK
jgi:hypothetical protein